MTACLPAGATSAQVPVTYYAVVQPINVCSTTATCPPVINLNDPVTGVNIANSIWSQVGIRVSFLPLVKWSSSLRAPLSRLGDLTTDYRMLHVCNCGSGTGACTSPAVASCSTGSSSNDLTVISQQPSISMNTVPNPTNPGPGVATPPTPTCAVANSSPATLCTGEHQPDHDQPVLLAKQSTPQPVRQISRSWGSVGIMATAATLPPARVRTRWLTSSVMCSVSNTRLWRRASDLSAPYPNSLCSENLMTAGSWVRKVPSSLNNCGAGINQACWFSQFR